MRLSAGAATLVMPLRHELDGTGMMRKQTDRNSVRSDLLNTAADLVQLRLAIDEERRAEYMRWLKAIADNTH